MKEQKVQSFCIRREPVTFAYDISIRISPSIIAAKSRVAEIELQLRAKWKRAIRLATLKVGLGSNTAGARNLA
jgi:hypothetical protein